MTSILNTSKWLLLLCFVLPSIVIAQQPETQTLTVSPTLFEMRAEPGQAWTSELRVINANSYEITVYPEPVNFAPLGEDGRGDLIPILEAETGGLSLAEWITVPSEPVVIPPQQTATIPLQVNVPPNAAPGGHYAAVLIGTKPPTGERGASQVQTAQFVTSLFFVRVAGDVREIADIREFVTNPSIVQRPEVELSLRFENTGNVHVQPQGDIKIFNMWGQERGLIPINHQTHFGNVLPESIRKFTFTWKGNTALYDIGRYKAVATLGYGVDGKQFVTSTTYFWIIPYTTILITLIVLIGIVKIGTWLIRRYIERMLALSGVRTDIEPYVPQHMRARADTKTVSMKQSSYRVATAPVRAGLLDMIASWRSGTSVFTRVTALLATLRLYSKFIAAFIIVVVAFVLITYSIANIMQEDTHFEVAINSPGADVVLSSEEIAYNELRVNQQLPETTIDTPPITVVNASGKVGAGARTQITLEKAGYKVYDLETDESRQDTRTIIVYSPKDQELALELSRLLTGALLSARATEEDSIIIFAGQDSLVE